MVRVNQDELETILALIERKYNDLGVKLQELDNKVMEGKTIISVKPSLDENSKLIKLIDTLDVLLEDS